MKIDPRRLPIHDLGRLKRLPSRQRQQPAAGHVLNPHQRAFAARSGGVHLLTGLQKMLEATGPFRNHGPTAMEINI